MNYSIINTGETYSFTISTPEEVNAYGFELGTKLEKKSYELSDYTYFCTGKYDSNFPVMVDKARVVEMVLNESDNSATLYFSVEHNVTNPNSNLLFNVSGYIAGGVIGTPIAPTLLLHTRGNPIKIKFQGQFVPYFKCPDTSSPEPRTYRRSISYETYTRTIGVDDGPNLPEPKDRDGYKWFSSCGVGTCQEA